MQAIWKDKVVAESDDTVVVEGNHYFPLASLDSSLVRDSDTTTFCPWKGTAHYYHLTVDGETNADARDLWLFARAAWLAMFSTARLYELISASKSSS